MADTVVTVDDGKYTFRVSDDGKVSCDRFDVKEWVVFGVGANALISLIHHAARLEQLVKEP